MRAGIAILGGGAIGAWAANELARWADPLRAPVVLFHEGDLASAAPATACLEPGEPRDGALRPTLIDGERAIAQFEVQIGRGVGFGRPGLLRLGGSGRGSEAGQRAPAHLAHELGLAREALEAATWSERAGLCDAERLHLEVLSLARTRGAITRPGVTVEALRLDPRTGAVVGIETSQGFCEVSQLLVADPKIAGRLVPDLARGLQTSERLEVHWAAPALGAAQGTAGPKGGLAELFELGADPESLETFFGAGEELEYAHCCLVQQTTEDGAALELFPDPQTGSMIVATQGPVLEREQLLALVPSLRALETERRRRRVQVTESADGLPIVGAHAEIPGLFVALGAGRRAAQVAAGLAPGIAAMLRGEAIAAFDPALLAPRATRRERS